MSLRKCAHCTRDIPPGVGVVRIDIVVPEAWCNEEGYRFLPALEVDGSPVLEVLFIMNADEEESETLYPAIPCGDPEDDIYETPLAWCWSQMGAELIEDVGDPEDAPPHGQGEGLLVCDVCGAPIHEGDPCLRAMHGYFQAHKLDLKFEHEGGAIDVLCAACTIRLHELYNRELWDRDVAFALQR